VRAGCVFLGAAQIILIDGVILEPCGGCLGQFVFSTAFRAGSSGGRTLEAVTAVATDGAALIENDVTRAQYGKDVQRLDDKRGQAGERDDQESHFNASGHRPQDRNQRKANEDDGGNRPAYNNALEHGRGRHEKALEVGVTRAGERAHADVV